MVKRGWKVGLGGLALAILLFFCIDPLLPKEPDGLDWIRKYKPTSERVFEPRLVSGKPIALRTKTIRYEFHFKDSTPQPLLGEIGASLEKEIFNTKKGLHTSNDYIVAENERNLVLVERMTVRSWFDQKWRQFCRSIGLLPMKQP